LNYWKSTVKLVFKQDLQSWQCKYHLKKNLQLAQSFARHCCSSKKQICINQRFQVYKIVLAAKETELGREPISKRRSLHLSCQGGGAPRQLRHSSLGVDVRSFCCERFTIFRKLRCFRTNKGGWDYADIFRTEGINFWQFCVDVFYGQPSQLSFVVYTFCCDQKS